MGREIKRVALDFKWPLGEIWEGFKPPPNGKGDCPNCVDSQGDSSGYGRMGMAIHSLSDYHHNRGRGTGILPADGAQYDEADLLILRALRLSVDGKRGLLPREEQSLPYTYGFGRSGMTNPRTMTYHLMLHLAESLGLPKEVFLCKICKGDGDVVVDAAQHALREAWVKTPPPSGEGWQIWETVSEGSPVSPVFPTSEELAVFMSTRGTKWDKPVSLEAAQAFIRSGWAPSGMILDGQMSTALDIPLVCDLFNARTS
jgi:hypothetical protein